MSSVPEPPSRTIRPIGRFGLLVMIALGLWCLLEVLFFGRWLGFTLTFGGGIGGGPNPWPTTAAGREQLMISLNLAQSVSYLLMCYTLVTAVAFVLWLFRARANAEAITPIPHARGRIWLVLGWIVPVVNLWFPYQVVQGIWRTSDPSRLAGGPTKAPSSRLVVAWWVTYLGYLITAAIGTSSLGVPGYPPQVEISVLISVPVGITAAVLAAAVVRDISRTQDRIAASLSPAPL